MNNLWEKLTSDAKMGKQMDEKEQKQDSTPRESVTVACLTCAFFLSPSFAVVPDTPPPPPSPMPLASDGKRLMSDLSKVILVLQDKLLLHKRLCFGQKAHAETLPQFIDLIC